MVCKCSDWAYERSLYLANDNFFQYHKPNGVGNCYSGAAPLGSFMFFSLWGHYFFPSLQISYLVYNYCFIYFLYLFSCLIQFDNCCLHAEGEEEGTAS